MRADLRGFKPEINTLISNTDNGGYTQIKAKSSTQKSNLGVKSDVYPCRFREIRVLSLLILISSQTSPSALREI